MQFLCKCLFSSQPWLTSGPICVNQMHKNRKIYKKIFLFLSSARISAFWWKDQYVYGVRLCTNLKRSLRFSSVLNYSKINFEYWLLSAISDSASFLFTGLISCINNLKLGILFAIIIDPQVVAYDSEFIQISLPFKTQIYLVNWFGDA